MRDSMRHEISKGGIRALEHGSEKSWGRRNHIQQIAGTIVGRITAPIGRRGFIEGYFILSLIALSLFALFLYQYSDFIESPQQLFRGITTLILDRNYYLFVVVLFFLSFGYLYLRRIGDSTLSLRWKGLFFLPLFFLYLSAFELILAVNHIIVETNFLQMIAAIKRFSQTSNGENFSQIVPQHWIIFLKSGAWRFQLFSLLHLLVLLLPLLLSSSQSLPKRQARSLLMELLIIFGKIIHTLFFTLALLWFLSSLLGWGYLTYLTFQMESGVQYLEDYQRFQTLLGG